MGHMLNIDHGRRRNCEMYASGFQTLAQLPYSAIPRKIDQLNIALNVSDGNLECGLYGNDRCEISKHSIPLTLLLVNPA